MANAHSGVRELRFTHLVSDKLRVAGLYDGGAGFARSLSGGSAKYAFGVTPQAATGGHQRCDA
jgi:hypothetical protein